MEINSKISPSLHPKNITAIDGYDDTTAGYVESAKVALELAYQSLDAVHCARTTLNENNAWSKEKKIFELAEFGEKNMDKVLPVFDRARTQLESGIQSVETAINESFVKTTPALAQEIRTHIKTMDRAARSEFVRVLLSEKNFEVLTAIADAPAFLSGMGTQEHGHLKRQLQESVSPELVKRVKVMKSALTMLESRGALVHTETEKAIGARFDFIAKMRKTESATRRALMIEDHEKSQA
ncbi:hypothetical protein [Alteromonas genovensis]|uniref:hypothetical protein n=1 Tax=Alteromonas genovensis TaxID=471225 RepID=UPI002FE386EF